MYFQKDYVLRMIEMMGELVRRICSIAREADARAELEEIAQKACGLPMEMLRSGDIDTLENLLEEPQRFLAAELIMISIEIDQRKNLDADALFPLYQQALMLYASLHDPDYVLPASDRAGKIVTDHLAQLPVEALTASAGLFERAGQYALAEDALYASAEIDSENAELSRQFYARMLALDERILQAGGLTRAEILEAQEALN